MGILHFLIKKFTISTGNCIYASTQYIIDSDYSNPLAEFGSFLLLNSEIKDNLIQFLQGYEIFASQSGLISVKV